MRATRGFSPARPRLNPCAGGASIRPPSADAGKPTREERHGQGSDAQQQGKEEAEGGVEQEEKGRPYPLAVRAGTGAAPARAEPLRQEGIVTRQATAEGMTRSGSGRGAASSPSLRGCAHRSKSAGEFEN